MYGSDPIALSRSRVPDSGRPISMALWSTGTGLEVQAAGLLALASMATDLNGDLGVECQLFFPTDDNQNSPVESGEFCLGPGQQLRASARGQWAAPNNDHP